MKLLKLCVKILLLLLSLTFFACSQGGGGSGESDSGGIDGDEWFDPAGQTVLYWDNEKNDWNGEVSFQGRNLNEQVLLGFDGYSYYNQNFIDRIFWKAYLPYSLQYGIYDAMWRWGEHSIDQKTGTLYATLIEKGVAEAWDYEKWSDVPGVKIEVEMSLTTGGSSIVIASQNSYYSNQNATYHLDWKFFLTDSTENGETKLYYIPYDSGQIMPSIKVKDAVVYLYDTLEERRQNKNPIGIYRTSIDWTNRTFIECYNENTFDEKLLASFSPQLSLPNWKNPPSKTVYGKLIVTSLNHQEREFSFFIDTSGIWN